MSLREKLASALHDGAHGDWWTQSDAVLAVIRAHLASDAAVERATDALLSPAGDRQQRMRAALLAAIGEEA